MIPSIATIVEDLCAGTITKSQAIEWLNQHAEDACRELRDDFAAAAMQGVLASCSKDVILHCAEENIDTHFGTVASVAFLYADAMLAEREKP